MRRLPPTRIVGIGGSAGALNAYTRLLDVLPSKTGMAFVFVYHVHPTAHTQLVLLLSRHTNMPVLLAANSMLIQANHVYVIAQNTDLFIEGDAFKVVSPRTRRNNQIDQFLVSLAESNGKHAIGIILSGYLGDGTDGCKHVKAMGGTTFAQDTSAEINDMPRSAQASGCIDFVLPIDKISGELQRLGALAQKGLRRQLPRHRDQRKKRG